MRTTRPDGYASSNHPSGDAVVSPRWISRREPSDSTTAISSTHARVLPYLKVAAPAALVATVPPTNAPSKVGTGGEYNPRAVSSRCRPASGTPAPTRTAAPAVTLTPVRFRVLRSSSPRGVAPPVSDDCAPIGSTCRADATSALTPAALSGNATPAAYPPATWAASVRN